MEISEEWLTTLESRLNRERIPSWENLDSGTLEAHIGACQADLLSLTQLSNDLTTSGHTRIDELFARPSSSMAASRRLGQLKTRFENLVEQVAGRREQCLKEMTAWNEAKVEASAVASLIGRLDEKLDKIEDGFSMREERESLKEFVQSQKTFLTQKLQLVNVRIREIMITIINSLSVLVAI